MRPSSNAPSRHPRHGQLELSPRTKKVLAVVISVFLVAILGGIATFIVVRVTNPSPPVHAAG